MDIIEGNKTNNQIISSLIGFCCDSSSFLSSVWCFGTGESSGLSYLRSRIFEHFTKEMNSKCKGTETREKTWHSLKIANSLSRVWDVALNSKNSWMLY